MPVRPTSPLIPLRPLLPDAQLVGGDEVWVNACSCDERQVGPGAVFVAVPGERGLDSGKVHEAVRRGCAAVLAEEMLPGLAVPVCLVDDVREAYGRLCQALAGDPSRKLKVIGVSGPGATSTSCLLASILTTAGYKVGVLNELGCVDGRRVTHPADATPVAEELAGLLARMVEHGCSHAVLEVSEDALNERRVAGVHFDAACTTDYQRAPARGRGRLRPRLLDYLSAQTLAVLNADDALAAGSLGGLDGPVLTVGVEKPAEITARVLEQSLSEQLFLLTAGSEVMPVRTPMIGAPHLYHCLTAAAVGLGCGIDLVGVIRGLEGVDYVPGQLQRIECGQWFGVFVDRARTPEALEETLATLRAVTEGRLICVFGGAGERARELRPHLGRAAESAADVVVLTSDNPRREDPQAIIHDILGGFSRPADAKVLPDRQAAIGWALAEARSGDCVLIAGKGHDTYQRIGRKRFPFDDGEVARQWLYEHQPIGV